MSRLGIAPIVTTNKAPKHYGVRLLSPWNESRDHGRKVVIDVWEESKKCHTMHWHIHKVSSPAGKGLLALNLHCHQLCSTSY